MKHKLQLVRAHTAPLEAIPATVGAALAVGYTWSPLVAMWGVFGILYHFAGYGHNSYVDWEDGHDKDDPHKQHHPLNQGKLRPIATAIGVKSLIILTFIYAVAATSFSVVHTGSYLMIPVSIAIILVAYASGETYNLKGKKVEAYIKPFYITIAHTSVFVLPYLSLGGDITPLFLVLTLYVSLWVFFQIAISGEVKDIMTDDNNILMDLGSYIHFRYNDGDGVIYFSIKSFLVACLIKIISLSLLLFYLIPSREVLLVVYTVSIHASMIVLTLAMLSYGKYMRDERIFYMSMIEILALSNFLVVASSSLLWENMTILFSVSIIWLLVFNKIEWDTWVSPKV